MRMGARGTALMAAIFFLATGCTGATTNTRTVSPYEASPTSTTTTATSTDPPSTTPPETVEEFLDGYIGAYRTGNPVFLIQRIHPRLGEFYGRDACRSVYEGFIPDDSARATIRSITDPVAWSEEFDGVIFTFPEVYTVDVDFVDFGSSRRQDMQLGRVGDRLYFFLDCGDPVVTTTSTVDAEQLDPDGDGFYYVHLGAGDSEDFLVPAMFRVTYTGSASPCAFQLLDSATGDELDYVTGLEGGGLKRIILPDPMTTVYVSDVLGCGDGQLQFGPNP